MKYSNTNKPTQCMMTNSTCYKGTRKMEVKGVLWHCTGVNNPNLKRYVQPSTDDPNYSKLMTMIGKNTYNNDLNHIYREMGMNAWIGKLADGTTTTLQTMPWDYRPWGCASGAKGSCNNGWIQFEMCEDALTDKTYFEAAYKEAVELTAYLCKMYNLDPRGTTTCGTATNVPVILCHYDSYKLGLGSNHYDIYNWFNNFGKTMEDVRNDVYKLLHPATSTPTTPTTPTGEMYRIRKTWADANSQVGAYSNLENAKAACDKAGAAYSVFDSKGNKVYPITTATGFKVGDTVKLAANATYINGASIPSWVKNSTLYVRKIDGNQITISTLQAGDITGVVDAKYLTVIGAFKPYTAKVTALLLYIRKGPGKEYGHNGTVKRGDVYTIVDEQNNFGKLKSGAGWLDLNYLKKV